jgi:hypothetical protein
MKKTLKRLKEDAVVKTGQYYDFMAKMIKILNEESSMDGKSRAFIHLIGMTQDTTTSLLRYIQALEDYGYELDEEWNKLLKRIEQAQEAKKEGTKKISYIK